MNIDELYTAGVRHALDLLGLWTQDSGAKSLRIYSNHPDLLRACLWRLPDMVEAVQVSQPEAPIDLTSGLVRPQVISNGSDAKTTDLALYPFSLDVSDDPMVTPMIAGCFHNALSYRKLLHPRIPTRSLSWLLAKLRREGYRLLKVVGIYPPGFLWYWMLSLSCGVRFSHWHYSFNQRAFERLSTHHTLEIFFSYLVAFYAKRDLS